MLGMKYSSRPYLNILEAHPHQEVCRPVGESGNCNGCRPGSLAEELSHDKPRNWPGSNFKEGYETEDGHNADVGHPSELVLKGGEGVQNSRWLPFVKRPKRTRRKKLLETYQQQHGNGEENS